jgi:hypothetical protein
LSSYLVELMRSEGYTVIDERQFRYNKGLGLPEEAMSETITILVSTLHAQRLSANLLPVGVVRPPQVLEENLAQPPGHDEPGESFAKYKRDPNGPGKAMSKELFYATIWVLQNGIKDPRGPSTTKDKKVAIAEVRAVLRDWYDENWAKGR